MDQINSKFAAEASLAISICGDVAADVGSLGNALQLAMNAATESGNAVDLASIKEQIKVARARIDAHMEGMTASVDRLMAEAPAQEQA